MIVNRLATQRPVRMAERNPVRRPFLKVSFFANSPI